MDADAAGGLVLAQTNQGVAVRGNVMRLTRYQVLFEMYTPSALLQVSDVLTDFRILTDNRPVYVGRAVISHLMNTGTVLICEATLEEAWMDVDFFAALADTSSLSQQFRHFIQGWQKTWKVSPEYKLIIADMHSFFMELRSWLDQVELGVRSSPSGSRAELERSCLKALAEPVLPCINELFARFERVAAGVEQDQRPAHRNYMRRQLHPFVLSAPFAYRTFTKPLGFAGDYEMVNMMSRDPFEGSTLFAKVLNAWFLDQMPARAHRNRIKFLSDRILEEFLRVRKQQRPARIFNLGCGPALEVQQVLAQPAVSDSIEFTLVDFNDETLQHLRDVLETASRRSGSKARIHIQKGSVQQILKEGAKGTSQDRKYDLIYCAGLLDYLPDPICQRLMNILYERLAPGGSLLATNVDPSNPMRNGMEDLLDWYLVYRDARQARTLKPQQASPEAFSVVAEPTGVNIFVEARSPEHG